MAEGPDEDTALQQLKEAIEAGLGEEEEAESAKYLSRYAVTMQRRVLRIGRTLVLFHQLSREIFSQWI